MLAGSEPPYVERIAHGGTLPDLSRMKVNLYVSEAAQSPTAAALSGLIRGVYHNRRATGEAVPGLPAMAV
jgi:hypothetical protein